MRWSHCRSLVLTLAAVFLAAATAMGGDQRQAQDRSSQGKATAAKAVAPGQIKRFHVTAQEGNIAPNTLRVKKGDTVRITFVSRDKSYAIRFDDFNIKDKVSREKPAVVEFVATQAGTFEFRCGKSMLGLKKAPNGTLIVK